LNFQRINLLIQMEIQNRVRLSNDLGKAPYFTGEAVDVFRLEFILKTPERIS